MPNIQNLPFKITKRVLPVEKGSKYFLKYVAMLTYILPNSPIFILIILSKTYNEAPM